MAQPMSSRKKESVPQPQKPELELEQPTSTRGSVDPGFTQEGNTPHHGDGLASTQQTPKYTGAAVQVVANSEAFKAIVIGNAGVGKSRMTYLYVNGEMPPETKSQTIGVEFYSKQILFTMLDRLCTQLVTKSMRVSFYDTAGQEKYNAITTAHYRKAMGALVCYSVTDRASFTAVDHWIDQVKENSGPACSIVLVANKSDVPFNEREVSLEEGESLAERHGLEFFEVSAQLNRGIDEAMSTLAKQMCLKYESLAGDFTAFNEQRLSVGGLTPTPGGGPSSFKIENGNSLNCCLARNSGAQTSQRAQDASSCC